MKTIKESIVLCLCLFIICLSGCGVPADPETEWEAAGVTEAFYRVAEDFSQRYLALDEDGARYDSALDTVAQYLAGTITQSEAQGAVQAALTEIEDALAQIESVTLSDELKENLSAVDISPAEYESFSNTRAQQLQSQEIQLSSLIHYLEYAEAEAFAWEDLTYALTVDQAEQELMRGYYYYGCFNYWFPGANEAEQALLDEKVTSHLLAYYPTDAVWYQNRDVAEDRVMEYLDQLEALIALNAAHLGQVQEDLYQMEQDFSTLLEMIEENQRLQETLSQMYELKDQVTTLQSEIAAAKEAGDEALLAELKIKLEEIVQKYEALTQEEIS